MLYLSPDLLLPSNVDLEEYTQHFIQTSVGMNGRPYDADVKK